MIDQPSAFIAIFPYAFIAAFPIIGIILVTKWELDSRRNRKRSATPSPKHPDN
jgi:hypothetical protein